VPLKRYTPLRNRAHVARGTSGIARKTPVKKVNAKRKASAWVNAYGSTARVRFVTRQPCAACGYEGAYHRQNAHTTTGGMSLKAHYTTIIPLCGPCHTKQHGSGWLAIGMTAESCRRAADQTERAWLERGQWDTEDAA
jgi:hypothetical protein